MANRSYLYTRHTGDDVEFRDIAEWNYDLPPAHLILVGANPVPCRSAIWEVDEKIAIEGDAEVARPLFLKLLDWLQPQLDGDVHRSIGQAREILSRPDRQGDKFHLELGELYELVGLELDEMEAETEQNAALARELFLDVQQVLQTDGSTIESFAHQDLRDITNWDDEFGLYFSHVLYFNLGG